MAKNDSVNMDAQPGNLPTTIEDWESMSFDLDSVPDPVYELMPSGIYDAVVDSAEAKMSQAGNPMVQWRIVTEYEGKNRTLFLFNTLNDNGLPRLRKAVRAANPDGDLSGFSIKNINQFVAGRRVRIKVNSQTYNNERRNNIQEVLPAASAVESFLT
jgi:hypothetical protein